MVYGTICQAQLFQVHEIINGFYYKSEDINRIPPKNLIKIIVLCYFETFATLYVNKAYFNQKVHFHITYTLL